MTFPGSNTFIVIYDKGVTAAEQRKPETANPYAEWTAAYALWSQGWSSVYFDDGWLNVNILK